MKGSYDGRDPGGLLGLGEVGCRRVILTLRRQAKLLSSEKRREGDGGALTYLDGKHLAADRIALDGRQLHIAPPQQSHLLADLPSHIKTDI